MVSWIKTPKLKDITKDLQPIALTANFLKILESIVGDWLWAIVKPHIKMTNMLQSGEVLLVML